MYWRVVPETSIVAIPLEGDVVAVHPLLGTGAPPPEPAAPLAPAAPVLPAAPFAPAAPPMPDLPAPPGVPADPPAPPDPVAPVDEPQPKAPATSSAAHHLPADR